MTKVYSGKKALRFDISDEESVIDEVHGLTWVKVNDEFLESKRIRVTDKREKYRVFDWGGQSHLEKGMNLSQSILENLGNAKVPQELIFKFYRNVVRFLGDEWVLPEDVVRQDCETIFDELGWEAE